MGISEWYVIDCTIVGTENCPIKPTDAIDHYISKRWGHIKSLMAKANYAILDNPEESQNKVKKVKKSFFNFDIICIVILYVFV